jgi:hypothetical protein
MKAVRSIGKPEMERGDEEERNNKKEKDEFRAGVGERKK